MKLRIVCLSILAVITSAAYLVDAKTPTPGPAAAQTPGPAAAQTPTGVVTPSESPKPVPTPTPQPVMSPSEQNVAMLQTTTTANAGPPPKPILYLIGSQPFTAGGKNYIRLYYDVFNKMDYPADMFAAAPALPPCGLNHNSSRTWVDFFDQAGHRIYGFCALSKPEDLGKIWIAYEEGTIPPSYVYIELNDRQTNIKYKSNLADTTL